MVENILKYKNFFGSVEYSAADDCYFGKIVGTTDLITFEGSTTEALKSAFIEAVEDYIILCGEANKKPVNSYSKCLECEVWG